MRVNLYNSNFWQGVLEYRKIIPFSGDRSAALSAARIFFISNHFTIQDSTDKTIRAHNNYYNLAYNILKLVSSITIIITETELNLYANLSGLKKMIISMWLVGLMFLGFGFLMLILIFIFQLDWINYIIQLVLSLVFGVLCLTYFPNYQKKQTIAMLDNLLKNIAINSIQ